MSIPNVFVSGQKAKSSEVNANFVYVEDEIKNERISLEGDYEVLNGCLVTNNDPVDNEINVAEGLVVINGLIVNVNEQNNHVLPNADSSNDRYDIICVDNNGDITVITGTPSSTPVVPSLTSNACPIATVLRPANNNDVLDVNLWDGRYFRNKPFVLQDHSRQSQVGNASLDSTFRNKKTLVMPPFVNKKGIMMSFDCALVMDANNIGAFNGIESRNSIRVLINGDSYTGSLQLALHRYYDGSLTGRSHTTTESGNWTYYLTDEDINFNQFNTFTLQLYRDRSATTGATNDRRRRRTHINRSFLLKGE